MDRFNGKLLRELSRVLTPQHCIMFDGAEQLGWFSWRMLQRRMRKAGGMLITAHQPGRLPTLIRCSTSPELLADLTAELLGEEKRAQLLPLAHRYFERHHGNIRDALREMYDRFEGDLGV